MGGFWLGMVARAWAWSLWKILSKKSHQLQLIISGWLRQQALVAQLAWEWRNKAIFHNKSVECQRGDAFKRTGRCCQCSMICFLCNVLIAFHCPCNWIVHLVMFLVDDQLPLIKSIHFIFIKENSTRVTTKNTKSTFHSSTNMFWHKNQLPWLY